MRKWMLGLFALLMSGIFVADALALEVSWRGRFRIRSNFGNWSNEGSANPTFQTFGNNQTELAIPAKDQPTVFMIKERARIWTTFKANEHLSATWGLEIGYLLFGEPGANEGARPGTRLGRGSGGGVAADGVNVETKHLHIDLDIPLTALKLTAGIQGLRPPLTNLGFHFFSDDWPAFRARGKAGPFDLDAGYIRLVESRNALDLSRANQAWYLSLGYPVSKDTKVAGTFMWQDHNDNTHYLVGSEVPSPRTGPGFNADYYYVGGNAATKLGPVSLAADLVYGWAHENQARTDVGGSSVLCATAPAGTPCQPQLSRKGFLAALEARIPVGPGILKLLPQITTGDSDREFGDRQDRRLQRLDSFPVMPFLGDKSNTGLMMLHGFDVGDEWIIVRQPSNDDLGLILGQVSYTVRPVRNLDVTLNVAPAWFFAENPDSVGKDRFMGVELSLPIRYRMWDQLQLFLVPGYFVVGDGLGTTPDCRNPQGVTLNAGPCTAESTLMGGRNLRRPNPDPDNIWMLKTQMQYVF